MYLLYVCENDACDDQGLVREVRPLKPGLGDEVDFAPGATECPSCGWFMAAV